jgi:hypothetical protein
LSWNGGISYLVLILPFFIEQSENKKYLKGTPQNGPDRSLRAHDGGELQELQAKIKMYRKIPHPP